MDTPATTPEQHTPDGTTTDTTTTDTERAGFIRAERVADVSPNATVVPLTDDRLAGVEPIETAVGSAVRNGTGYSHVEGDSLEEAQDALASIPGYTEDPRKAGYYVEWNGTTVRLYLAVEE